MGLTFQSTKNSALTDIFHIDKNENQIVIALAGNPNTGKSTVFNSLTGLHQHTGNWPGKTVVNARGEFKYEDKDFILVDLPGTYSLFSSSVEEEVARDFICFGNADAVVVVADATCLERNLNLVYQVMELTYNVVLCINLIDEAKKKRIEIDAKGLEKELGIPIVLCAARSGIGITDLKQAIYEVSIGKAKPSPKLVHYDEKYEEMLNRISPLIEEYSGDISPRWIALRIVDGDEKLINSLNEFIPKDALTTIETILTESDFTNDKQAIRDKIATNIYKKVEDVTESFVKTNSKKINRDRIIDNYITSKRFGLPLMILTLALIFWITISGANYPSALLSNFFMIIEGRLTMFFEYVNAPAWLHGVLVLGLYRTMAWVVAVMLPPMAIFFPLFTILEDLGYLPRVAFNMDHLFKKACAHGKQCLTMCMGFGCNAAGVIACRIIESPRERLIATLTNNFVPCNGRFPTLIAISTVFLVSQSGSSYGILPVLSVTGLVIVGIVITLLVSYLLSKTLLKGIPSTFTLELPPYRVPRIGRVLYSSIIDRTAFVLWRAIIIAAPAGAITWILGNIYIGDLSLIGHAASFFNPAARLIGLDGYILMAFILGLPANEIVLPILLMSYLSTGSIIEFDSIDSLRRILLDNGWTYLTALNTMLFSLLHWPCATTLITIKKETGSIKWTALSAIIPTGIAIAICLFTTLVFRLFGWA
ncbi:MAG: ferrous iron transport protein B [Clostridiales bacterium]|jgi:ferrous iron transport protein B|nr:ferrous iron transport protein B [Clostridiales bacterium]